METQETKELKLPGILSLNRERIHNLKFSEKFDVAFRKVIVMVGLATAAIIATVLVAAIGLNITYNRYYQEEVLQADIRIDIQALSKAYLWALSTPDPNERTEQLKKASEKYPEMDEDLAKLEKIYTGEHSISDIANDIQALDSVGQGMAAEFEKGAPDEEIFTYFDEQLYPAIDAVASDFKDVSEEITAEGKALYTLVRVITIIGIIITIILVGSVFIYLIDMKKKLTEAIVTPVREISKAADDMAAGRLSIDIGYTSGDELGRVAQELNAATTSIENVFSDISVSLGAIAEGDFSKSTDHPELYVEDYKAIKEPCDHIVDRLSEIMSNIKDSSNNVAMGASNMSDGAAGLAEGATDQAAAIEELTASVQTVSEQTKVMAESAQEGSEKATVVRNEVEVGVEKMSRVTEAMNKIAEASKQIEQVSHTIDDIASQTQLLSLNASIEAARAGEAGKGFAVVAEEISNLAIESGQAVKDTQELVNGALVEINAGTSVVTETQDAFEKVKESVDEVVEMIRDTGEIASNQTRAMDEISGGIEQISNVIQDNTATAEESSAVSNELSEQSENLNDLLSQFILKA